MRKNPDERPVPGAPSQESRPGALGGDRRWIRMWPAAGLIVASLVTLRVTAAPPPAPPPAPPSEAAGTAAEAGAASPAESRRRLEAGMSTLGALVADAREDSDMVRLNCLVDKRDRADEVMELATDELLVIRNPQTTEQARAFAREKLEAAATRLEGLVQEAAICDGDQAPEDSNDATRNESSEPKTIPVNDATGAAPGPKLPPVLDPDWLPVTSGIQ